MELSRNFVSGRMNKMLDERLIPQGEVIHAVNMRFNSTENNDSGTGENTMGNLRLTGLSHNGAFLSDTAVAVGAFEDGIEETMYWFVHSPVDGVDMVVSYSERNSQLKYHIIAETVLDFDEDNLILSVNRIDDLIFFVKQNGKPMVFNRRRTYPREPNLIQSDLLVIKAPPSKAPDIDLVNISGGNNYLDTRFISFSYKYKYRDGEYSALSSWSQVSFIPKAFRLNPNTYQNEGMTNSFNGAKVSFETGGPNVSEVVLCFRVGNESVVNVVEKYDKNKMGWSDNSTVNQLFTGNKIFTTLQPSELLRLFDNVPTKAFAQTMMGNRLMYGNYTDGFPLIDGEGNDFDSSFLVGLESSDIGFDELPLVKGSTAYSIDPGNPGHVVLDTNIEINFEGVNFIEGSSIGIDFVFRRASFTGTSIPDVGATDITIQFFILLKQDYATPHQFASSPEFIEAIGDQGFFVGLAGCGTSNRGSSLTDRFVCDVSPPSGWSKVDFGITELEEGFKILSFPGSNLVQIIVPAIIHEEIANPGQFLYEYFSVTGATAFTQDIANNSSMHSNRDYTVGMIYLDDFNRQTTAIVSPDNTVHIPSVNSIDKNILTVQIPVSQKPPAFAKKYKFAVMSSGGDYETIYTNQFFTDPADGSVYFKLEGDNQTKCRTGDRLIVKVDSNGPVTRLVESVVLDISPKERDFIPDNKNSAGQDIQEPPGLYMRMKPDNWSAFYDGESILGGEVYSNNSSFPVVQVNLSSPDPDTPGAFIPWSVPEGSIVRFDFSMGRSRRRAKGSILYTYEKEYVATRDYENVYDFVINQNIRFDTGINSGTDPEEYPNIFTDCLAPGCPLEVNNIEEGINKYQFREDPDGRLLFTMRSGAKTLTGVFGQTESWIKATVTVIKSNTSIVFETQPQDTNPDIYFIGSKVYDIVGGFHTGGEQNQSAVNPAIIKLTDIHNCFTFGNGVESYKIRDALAGQIFRMGQVSTSVSNQDYGEQNRYASITYSGVYNPETNVNNLNEFNLGLANFKDLEKIFGPIRTMHPRMTDVLVLQEDKISYVLAGKNILSDAGGGSVLTSIPEVLGQQVARVEEFGISNHPESFCNWGSSIFFTDSKRGSVLMLTGSGSGGDQIKVISEDMMDPWFRDTFIEKGNTRILGGYDPFNKEYLLSFTDQEKIEEIRSVPCGSDKNILIGDPGTTVYDVEFGQEVGNVTVNYRADVLPAGSSIQVSVLYNGVTYNSPVILNTTPGSLVFNKNSPVANKAVVTVTQVGEFSSWSVNVSCPDADVIRVFRLTVNSFDYKNQLIHQEFGWEVVDFSSVINSEPVKLIDDNSALRVSQFSAVEGPEGLGSIPITGSTLKIISNKRPGDSFDFEPSFHKLRYLVTNTLYGLGDAETILNLSTPIDIPTNPSPGRWVGEFDLLRPTNESYLYLVYDYRKSVQINLCYSPVSAVEACCDCII